MRIEVISGDESSTPQARAYAEYRMFAALARYTRAVRSASVVLRQGGRVEVATCVTCVVEVVLEPSGSVRARARAPHAYGAIDRAAARIGDLVNRKTLPGPSS